MIEYIPLLIIAGASLGLIILVAVLIMGYSPKPESGIHRRRIGRKGRRNR